MNRPLLVLALTASTALATCVSTAAADTPGSTTTLTNSGKLSTPALQITGTAPDASRLTMSLQVGLPSQAEAEKLAASGTVMTPEQFHAKFATTDAALAKAANWAKSQGLAVNSQSTSGGEVVVSGTVAQVNRALKVHMKKAKLHGQQGLAVDTAPQVPTSTGLTGIAGLNTVSHVTPDSRPLDSSQRTAVTPDHHHKPGKPTKSDGVADCAPYWGDHLMPSAKKYDQESNVLCGYTPKDLQKMYGSESQSHSKPTLGILLWGGDTDIQQTTNDYMKDAGYKPLKDFKSVIETPNANMANCGPYDIQGEQALDVQSTHAIAPDAAIRYYGASSCYDADLTGELQKMVDAHEVSTISMSFGNAYDDGLTEADQEAWDRPLMQAALTGISTFASSGDDGNNSTSNDLGANHTPDGKPHAGYPATSAMTTAVGGTSVGMKKDGSQPVVAGWEDQFYLQPDLTKKQFSVIADHPVYGAGGGVSAVVKQPFWQRHIVSNSTTMRAVPDIAALGDPYTGYTTRFRTYELDANGNPTGTSQVSYSTWGGTSLASPIVAAMTGLAKEYKHSHIGLITPWLYSSKGHSLKDVNYSNKSGIYFKSSKWGQEVVAFDGKPQDLYTTRGWDNVTGLGTPYGMDFFRSIPKY